MWRAKKLSIIIDNHNLLNINFREMEALSSEINRTRNSLLHFPVCFFFFSFSLRVGPILHRFLESGINPRGGRVISTYFTIV